ncbi:hypothetical protein [Pseudoalteromonas sp. BMB]|uniref:hypothetical protein n=1 Tax=Pseudoalteromonas sp. BMB TaxID=1874619 RepID=UPI001585FE38|nr:hypothetical protein [Pseudoalteromonas sp. BMB]
MDKPTVESSVVGSAVKGVGKIILKIPESPSLLRLQYCGFLPKEKSVKATQLNT